MARYVVVILALALVVRLGAYVLFNVVVFDGQFQHPDSYLYHYISLELQESWRAGDFVLTHYPAYTNFTALLYFLPGPDRFWPELANMVLSVGTVGLGMASMVKLGAGRRAVAICGLVLALDPYIVYLSTQYLRDTLLLFGGAVVLYSVVAAKVKTGIGALAIIAILRPLQAYGLAPLLLFFPRRWALPALLAMPVAVVAFMFIAPANFVDSVPLSPNATFDGGPHVEFFEPHGLNYHVPWNQPGEWWQIASPAALTTALRAFLVFPYPWQADTWLEAGFGAYMAWWYALLAFGSLGIAVAPKGIPKIVWVLAIWVLASGVLLTITTESQGPLVRWRMQLYYYLIPILSMGVGNLMGYAAAKRAFDLVVSVGAVFMLAPIWLGIGTILALTRHQIFFKQSRRGLDGKEFTVYKFVTMRPDSEGAPLEDDDPRVTRFGRILRKTALDELPEVWSIIKGDMSIVGPRALAIWEDSKCRVDFGKAWEQRYEVKPGLIGLAQLKCDRRDNFNKLYWDVAYIAHRSFWFDLKLFLQGSIGNVTGRWK